MSQATIWCPCPAESAEHSPLTIPPEGVAISPAGVASALEADSDVAGGALLLLPVDPETGFRAVALALLGGRDLLCNGVRMGVGLHFLAHEDRLGVAARTFWFSAAATPERACYDPQIHGEDVFCFRTKKRIAVGEAIIICPGTPQRECGMIFRESAWEIGVACHSCHYDPSTRPWRPPSATGSGLLRELLDLAREPEEGGDER